MRGFTGAPTVRPQDMSLTILQSDLQQTCGPRRRVTDGGVCDNLRSTLEQATRALQRGDRQGAKGSIRAFLDALEAQHGPGKPVSDNAYW